MADPDPAPVPALEPAPSPARDTSKHGRRLSTGQIIQALALHADGVPQPEIAIKVGCSLSTIWDVVSRYQSSTALATKFLEAQALSAAHSWTRAVKTGAKRGRHEPARDLLLHTGAIQPVQNETSGQAKLAVFIGVSVQEQDTLLVDAQPVDEPIVETQPIVGNGTETS